MSTLRDKLPSVSNLQERLSALKEKTNLKTGNLNFYVPPPKKKGEANTAIVRIMPHPKYEYTSFIETWVHYFKKDGESKAAHNPVECPKLNGLDEGCAICEHRQYLYDCAVEIAIENGVDPKNYEEKIAIPEVAELHKLARAIRSVKRVQVPVLVRTREEAGILFWGIQESVYTELFKDCVKAAAKYSDKNPLNPLSGVDVEVSVTLGERYTETKCDVLVGDVPSKCLEGKSDEEIEEIIQKTPDIWGTVCRKQTYAITEKVIEDLQGPDGYINLTVTDDEDEDGTTESVGVVKEVKVEVKKISTPVSKRPVSTSHKNGNISKETEAVTAKALAEIDELNSVESLNDEI